MNFEKVKQNYVGLLTAALMAGFLALGQYFTYNETVRFKDLKLYITFLLWFVISCLIIVACKFLYEVLIPKFFVLNFIENTDKYIGGAQKDNYIRQLVTAFIIYTVELTPAFLALFPGYLSYDGPLELSQFFTDHVINGWHPVIYTLSISGAVAFGDSILGSAGAGLALFSIIIGLMTSLALAFATVKVSKFLKVSYTLCLGIVTLSLLNPIMQIFVFATAKDTAFAIFFVVVFVYICEMVCDEDSFFSNKKSEIIFVLVAILMMLNKRQGLYVFLITMTGLFIFLSKYRKEIIVLSLLPIIIVELITGPGYQMIGVIPGRTVEAYSVPLQQIARTVKEDKYLDEETLEDIYKFIPQEVLGGYIPQISDPIKDSVNEEYFTEHKREFLKLWARLLPNHLGIYIDSFLYVADGYIWPARDSINQWGTLMYPYPGGYIVDVGFDMKQEPILQGYYGFLMDFGQTFADGICGIEILVSLGFPFYVLLMVAGIVISQKKYRLLLPLILLLSFQGILFLAPVCCVRYICPLLYCLPFVLILPAGAAISKDFDETQNE